MRFTFVAAWLAVSSSVVLFPTPLHIVRRIDDPIAGRSETVEEYCSGNRVVTVNGPRVAISDYGAQTLTEIDHQHLTYSIARFDEIARSHPHVSAKGVEKQQITIDRHVALTREAVEVLIGAAYPRLKTAEHDEILRAAAPPGGGRIAAQSAETLYGLPAEQSIAFEHGLTWRNVVVRVDHDLAPPRVMLIDPGATRLESHLTRMSRELQQLDALPRH